jgi:hypothetical protein
MNYYDLTISTGSDYEKVFTLKQNNLPIDITTYTAVMYLVKNDGSLSTVTFSTAGGEIVNGGANGTLTLSLTPADILTIDGKFYKLEIDDGTVETEILSGNIFILDETKAGVEYLIPILRMQLGDTDPLSYRYLDEWLKVALTSSVKILQRWWGDRYIIDDSTGEITRSTTFEFTYLDPPIIQGMDERPIILMASILVKSGQLEANSWNAGSWKDAEIAVSNIEGSKAKQFGYGMDWEELKMYILPPTKRLSQALRIAHPSTEE